MARKITVSGTNLFRVAAEQYGDATQWWRIKQANNLSTTDVPGIVTLTIPDYKASTKSGLPSVDER